MSRIANDNQGKSFPLGATVLPDGVNFSIFSKHSTAVDLLLFERADDTKPSQVVALDSRTNRTYHYWRTFVPGVKTGQLYAYRVHGPYTPERGLRFDPDKFLLDPYGKCVVRLAGYSRRAACHSGDNAAVAIKSAVTDPGTYDWEGDSPPRRPFAKTVLYEMHVGGFTRHPSSGIATGRRGTYAGLADKISYLQELGITAVELLPVFAFDEQDGPAGLGNYWGYAPLSFFAPHEGYSSRPDPLEVLDEFRDMVKALHRAGIEVLLDVVYNHTTEGNETGPTLCFRGLANDTYYILEEDRSSYANYSGCGNTLNANESVCRRLILDSLRYWVSEMHVDVLIEDYSTRHRMEGVGVMSKEDAYYLGTVGPMLRASGIPSDTRQIGYAAYKHLSFEPVTAETGDCYARCVVRVKEIFVSIDLVRQLVDKIPDGPIELKVKGMPSGEFFGRIEQPRGEVIYYVKGNGTKFLERFRVPTLANLPGMIRLLKGAQIADVPVIILTIDPCISCTER
jgi:glycogen debranching enzyme GlgX